MKSKYIIEVFYQLQVEAETDHHALNEAAYETPCSDNVRKLSMRVVHRMPPIQPPQPAQNNPEQAYNKPEAEASKPTDEAPL